jgi:4-deoxy-L-threo-5-hexosulose-uronate ketol-isomerase
MKLESRYATHPADSQHYDTAALRKHYWQGQIFAPGEICLTYSHNDRIIFGGAMPLDQELRLEAGKELGADYFLERRELGLINIGGRGSVVLDGVAYDLDTQDGLYAPLGVREVVFCSADSAAPAKFYLNSCPAHQAYAIKKIALADARHVHLGDPANLNVRTIHQYVHPDVCRSCQLVMGMTILEPGSVWNTMPCHTHARRMEVYFYFGFAPEQRVFHLMGEPQETRHLVIGPEEAVISPSWSIHAGVGTTNYTFIWGMCGENQTFADMDMVTIADMR